MADIIQLRRDTAANWTSANPILALGELGFEIDTTKFKVGNGVGAWATLAYWTAGSTALLEADLGVSVQEYDATILVDADIGTTVASTAGQVFTGDIAAPKITASTGVLFGTDTSAANTLDDYEEGTWTINEVTAGTQANTYTKVGRLVTIQINITGPTTFSNSSLTGLPFSSSSWAVSSAVYADGFTSTAGSTLFALIGDGVLLHLREQSESGGIDVWPDLTGAEVRFSVTYMV